jgi:uncharacterized protein YqeY
VSAPDPTLQARLRTDLGIARKERDKLRTTVLTTLLAEVRNREIEAGGALDEEGVQGAVVSAIKRRREAAEQMRAGSRDDLAEKEDREAALLAHYLPPQLGEEEVRAMIREAIEGGADNLGAVMKQVSPRVRGRFEGRELNRLVREALA